METDLLAVVAAVYDAAVTSDLWPNALESCREFTGGVSAAIFAKDVTGNRRQLFHIDDRLDPEQTRVYFSRLAPIDPSNTVQVYAEIEEGVVTSQRLDPDDFAQSRFAAEWATPQGIVDVGFATLERRGDWAALFGVFRHERDGLGDETMRQRLTLLAPHVRRAINIAGVIGRANREADTFRGMIDGLAVTFATADVEALPFADGTFDYVLSTFGVMFAPNQEQAAAELLRVTRPRGKIGLANWTPAGFIGQVFKTLGKHVAPPAGLRSPALWGDAQHLANLFAGNRVTVTERVFNFRYRSASHFIEVFRTFYGPVHKAFLNLDEAGRTALHRDLTELIESFDVATNGSLMIPSTYAEVIVEKA